MRGKDGKTTSCYRSEVTNIIIPVKYNLFRNNMNPEHTFTECALTGSVEILRIWSVAKIAGNVPISLAFTLKIVCFLRHRMLYYLCNFYRINRRSGPMNDLFKI